MKINYQFTYKLILLSILTISFSFYSCSSDSEDDLIPIENNNDGNNNEDGNGNDDTDSKTTYISDVKPIIDNNCVSCHSTNGSSNFYLLQTYDQVKASAQSGKLYGRMTDASDPMPPSGILPGTVTQIIQNWINDGLLEE